jgi:hypothetical protein
MPSRIRAVLMWVLLFALPFQGYAAATLPGCGPDHHRVSAHAMSAAAPVAASAHVHLHDAAADDHHADPMASKCSVCAACCVGAALPAAPLLFSAASSAAAPTAWLSIGKVGFLTGGPDRPPRPSLV